MKAVVLVPGVMGTELFLSRGRDREKIWPPTPTETQFGYKRSKELQSPNVVPGDIIRNVLCFDFYRPLFALLEELGYSQESPITPLIAFPYDWRLDLFTIAQSLAVRLESAVQAGAKTISLVAHSMGGLVCRILLEDPCYRNASWFERVDLFIAIATPHLGAPLALGRVLGRDSAMGISGKDFAEISNNEAFPSAYQLLPAPGELACWDQNDPFLTSLDIYDPVNLGRLGLKQALIDRVKALHVVLGAGNQPAGKRYFYFAGAGHRTVTRVNVYSKGTSLIDNSRTELTRTADGGDGTVPMYSALPYTGQRQIVTNEHATAFKGEPFRRAFVRLLGGNEGDALEHEGEPLLAISIESPVVTVDEDVEVLLYPIDQSDDATGSFVEIKGELVLQQVLDRDAVVDLERQRITVSYAGPPVNRLRLYLAGIADPGHYRLRFEGSPIAVSTGAFSVCAPLARMG